jgi:membrane-associated phospholipid phosphatase
MLDFVIAKALNAFGQGTVLDYLSGIVSLRSLMAVVIIIVALLILQKDKKRGKIVFVAILVALSLYFLVTEGVIKEGIASFGLERARPYIAHPGEILPIGTLNTDSSFPSGHVASLTAFLFVICYYYRKNWVWITSIAAILLMGFSRIHNGMHYPSDVLGGIAFGMVYGWVAIKISGYFGKRKFTS